MPFFHGIQVSEPVDGVRPILEKSTAVIGLVAHASDADAAHFPLNKAVLITNIRSWLRWAGEQGTLLKALTDIANQGSPLVIVVRIAEGIASQGVTIDQATAANAIGGNENGVYTGMQAFLGAEAATTVKPRILIAPGIDTQEVTEALVIVAKKLRGFVYARAIGASIAAAATYAGNFADRELMLLWPDFTGWTGQAVAIAAGLRAALDESVGWHKSLSNVAVAGVTGLSKGMYFDLQDQTSDAGVLNQANVTALIHWNGYRFWGNRSCSDEPLFAFEVATRTAQIMADVMAEGFAAFIDKPITIGLLRDILETGNAKLRQWTNEGRLIGGSFWYDPDLNPAEQLADGKAIIDYDFTPCAPLEGLGLNQRITSKYYSGFGDALASITG